MITLAKIEDREGDGTCSSCNRQGLRWIAVLSDGTAVGLECANKILGFRPARTAYSWAEHFTAVAEHTESGSVYVLWQRKGGRETRETRNGILESVGGARRDWISRGWTAE
jgi:hypothetical protein